MNACSKQDLRAIRILLLIFDLNQKNKTMEQTLKQPAEQAAFTREELMRRLEEHRRKKKEIIRMMEDYLKEECKKRTGREPESFEVW